MHEVLIVVTNVVVLPSYCNSIKKLLMVCMLSLVLMLHASVSASVVGYACISGSIFHTVTKWFRRPTDHFSAAKYSIKMSFLFVKQPLRKATEFASKLLLQL